MTTPRLTAEDVLREASPWRDCELWDGLPMVCEPSGGRAQAVASQAVISLGNHVRRRKSGWVFLSEQGFLVARDPDRLLAPDAAYVSRERLTEIPERGFIPLAPDFAIEVKSPTDAWEATVEKCGIWIAHGTSVAWAIDPETKRVAVFRSGLASTIVDATGQADAAPALPGFRLPVRDLFEALEE